MGDTIKLRAGNHATMPRLYERELAYCKDENALYIGTGKGNRNVSGTTLPIFTVETQAVSGDAEPNVTIINENPASPHLIFQLPKYGEIILTSPGGKRFLVSVDDNGTLQTSEYYERG